MAYLSLYRKYRSQTFGDLVGQDHVVKTLQNAISTGRIAHAYLFTGPRGTGKTSSARLLAKALNAENGPTPTPSDDDPICRLISTGECVDVVEMDAASEAGVDSVRDAIIENVQYQPMMCRYKIFIIDEVHDLSGKAFDALLKTIEEPPPHVVFILATTEYNKVPPTIRSRCQKFEFHRGSIQDLVERLQMVATAEGADIEPAALTAIARMADGGFRDALTLLEQAMLTTDGRVELSHVYDQLGLIPDEIVDQLLLGIKEGDVPKIVEILNEVSRLGRDPRALLESMLHRAGELTRASYGIDVGGLNDSAAEASLHETSTRLGRDFLLETRATLTEAHKVIRDISLPRLWLESELIRVATVRPESKLHAPSNQAASKSSGSTAVVNRPEPRSNGTTPAAVEPAPKPIDPSGNEDLDRAQELWQQVLAALPNGTPMWRKLQDSRVASVDGQRLEILVMRAMDAEWMTEKPDRSRYVLTLLKSITAVDFMVTYAGEKKAPTSAEPQAVELPLEGQKLADTVREIFGAN
jgi:DNA polymerase-3 subunit gamma/tau